MVRLKNRWLIAQVDYAEHLTTSVAATGELAPKADLPSRKQIFLTLSDAVLINFGIARGRGLRDTQGKERHLTSLRVDALVRWNADQHASSHTLAVRFFHDNTRRQFNFVTTCRV
jgi:hypothetical protein